MRSITWLNRVSLVVAGVGSDDLCMDAETISDILQCRITTWDHSNISRLNPGFRYVFQGLVPIALQMFSESNSGLAAVTGYADVTGRNLSGRWGQCTCRLPAQPINVTIDPVNLAVVHTLAKYLSQMASQWALGSGYTLQWPSCVHLQNSLYGAQNQSRPFEKNYTFG